VPHQPPTALTVTQNGVHTAVLAFFKNVAKGHQVQLLLDSRGTKFAAQQSGAVADRVLVVCSGHGFRVGAQKALLSFDGNQRAGFALAAFVQASGEATGVHARHDGKAGTRVESNAGHGEKEWWGIITARRRCGA